MIGKTLREKREALGISLAEASHHTQIKQEFLRMLEEEDYVLLPDPFYLSGFLRRYANFLNLDGDALLSCFQQEVTRPVMAQFPSMGKESLGSTKRWRRTLLWAVFSAAAAGVLAFPICWISQQGEQRVHSPISPGSSVSPPRGERRGSEPSGFAGVNSAPKGGVHVLSLFARQRTWLTIQADQGRPREIMLREGERITLAARQYFRITLGNAGGVEMVLDGKPMPPPGSPGQVVRGLVLPPP